MITKAENRYCREPANNQMHLTGGILAVKLDLRHPESGSGLEGDPEPAPGK